MRRATSSGLGFVMVVATLCIVPDLVLYTQGTLTSSSVTGGADTAESNLPRLGLPIKSAPLSILSFYILHRRLDKGSYEVRYRLAVLTRDFGLRLFKPDGIGNMATTFSIEPPQTEEWGNLESFPSEHYPGVIIRGNYTEEAEHGGPVTIALCYIGGKFQVVFKGGATDFVFISKSKMPEAIEYAAAEPDPDSLPHALVHVWT